MKSSNHDLHTLPKVRSTCTSTAASYDVVRRLAPDATPRRLPHFVAPPKCWSLASSCAPAAPVALMQSEEALRLVVDDLFVQFGRDGVIYAEIRFAPLFHTRRGISRSRSWRSSMMGGAASAGAASSADHPGDAAPLQRGAEPGDRAAGRAVSRDRIGRSTSPATRPATRSTRAWPRSFRHRARRPRPMPGKRPGRRRVGDAALLQPRGSVTASQHRGRGAHGAPGRDQYTFGGLPTCNVQTDVVTAYSDHPVDILYGGASLGISAGSRTVTDVTLTQE